MTIKELHKIVTELQERVHSNERQIQHLIEKNVEKIGSLYEAVEEIRGLFPGNNHSEEYAAQIAFHVGGKLEDWGIDREFACDALSSAARSAEFPDNEPKNIWPGNVFARISTNLDFGAGDWA